ncbi:lipopolysaccharide biosynthesis protein [Muricoccus aerilatus]|uniref:lipopolysaccharide biosynthesis protein n=1 Tax=Muricoccus aerilatus TaxID=452982 RepID=UPI0005C2264B|nr:oligosaccharide flippase family protein [Roseomonas aerilata]
MRQLLATLSAPLSGGVSRQLSRNTTVILAGYGVQLVTQMGWLLLAVRTLGPAGYGLFASLTAITIAASCFVGWGCDQLLIRAVSRDAGALRPWLGHSLGLITVTGVGLILLGMLVLPVLEVGRIGALPLFLVLVSDLVLARYANLCIAVFMATEQAWRQSAVTIIIGGCRLVAITAAALLPGVLTIQAWSGWYAGASMVAAVLCLGMTIREHGAPLPRWMGGHLAEGITFAAESAVQASARDLDKPIVLEVAGAEAAGLYAAAFRIVETLGMPVRALASATYARMFRLAHEDPGRCVAYANRLIPAAAAMAGLGGLALALAAGLLPLVFGERYAELPLVVRLTAVFPLFAGVYGIWADALSATGRQRHRLALVCVSLVLTMVLCWIGVTAQGLEGAALARVAVMGITAALAWAALPRRS